MYTMILDEGIVIRDADQVIVSPVFSPEDPDFLAYAEWVKAGNEPVTILTRT